MTILVAELGINHQGDWDLLKDMALTALKYVNYVKVQIRTPRVCVPKEMWEVQKETPWGETTSYIDYRERMEVPFPVLDDLMGVCGLDKDGYSRVFASFWDENALVRTFSNPSWENIQKMRYIKVPSAKLADHSLLRRATNAKGKRVILSTGMSTEREVDNAVDTVLECNPKYIPYMLVCNSEYPAPTQRLKLGAIGLAETMYGNSFVIGYSSHATSPYPAIYASVLGAQMIEVHYTKDRTMLGSDHSASLEESGLKLIRRELDRVSSGLKSDYMFMLKEEIPARKKLRG